LCAVLAAVGCGDYALRADSQTTDRASNVSAPSPSSVPEEDEVTPLVEALGSEVDALNAEGTVRVAADGLAEVRHGLQPALGTLRATLQETISYHQQHARDCAGIASRADAVADRAREASDVAGETAAAAESLKLAAAGLAEGLANAWMQLDQVRARVADAEPSTTVGARLAAYDTALQGLGALQAASAQSARDASAKAAAVAEGATRQVETAQRVADVCQRQAAARADRKPGPKP
jgi:hypothetical protein